MAAASITLSSSSAPSPFAPLKQLREHLDLISYTVTMVSNAVFLAGKLFSTVPELVTRTSFLLMNTVGLLYLDWQVSATVKSSKDCQLARRVCNWPLVGQTALCTLNGASDTLLIIGGFLASLASWAKYPSVRATLYTIMRPWGVTFIFVAAGLDVLYYLTYRRVTQQLERVCQAPDSVLRAKCILHILKGGDGDSNDAHLASLVRASMDKYTLEVLLSRLDDKDTDSLLLLTQIKENIATQHITERITLGLRAIGYVALGLNKAFPDTLVQPITYFATSLLYAANRAYKKWQEARQRQAIVSHSR